MSMERLKIEDQFEELRENCGGGVGVGELWGWNKIMRVDWQDV